MLEKKAKILSCTIDEDQAAVAEQWANTFIYNSKPDPAVTMTQLSLACLACGEFKVRPYLADSLQDPSDQLNIVDYLSHGSRIILDYEHLSAHNKKELLNFFPKEGPRSATHNAYRTFDGTIEEGKGFILGAMGQLPAVIKTPQDFGVNIAMGGEGQVNFKGKTISSNGFSGHVYFHRNDSEHLLMIGLEQTAPAASALDLLKPKVYSEKEQHTHDQFGQGHSLTGASDTYTAAGSLYFSDPIYQAKLLVEKGVFPPDKYGAMHIKITDEHWAKIKEFWSGLKAQSVEDLKPQLLKSLCTKPVSASKEKGKYSSYIALNFKNYLSHIHKIFIHGPLDDKIRILHENLLETIKELQEGRGSYDLFKERIKQILEINDIPLGYTEAITRIQSLFTLQKATALDINQTQKVLLKNQYEELEEEAQSILKQLSCLSQTEEVKKHIDILTNHLHLKKETDDLTGSWIVCSSSGLINKQSVEQLEKAIELAKSFIKETLDAFQKEQEQLKAAALYPECLKKINSAGSIEDWNAHYSTLDNLFKTLSPHAQAQFNAPHTKINAEKKLFDLYSDSQKIISLTSKKQKLDKELDPIIKELSHDQLSRLAKDIWRRLSRTQLICRPLKKAQLLDFLTPFHLQKLEQWLNPILNGGDTPLKNKLTKALEDNSFSLLLLANPKKITSELIKDLLILRDFRDNKLKESEQHKFSAEYNQSIKNFYQRALTIRLSNTPLKEQGNQLIAAAQTEFAHRHYRLLADALTLICSLGVVTIFMGIGRLIAGCSFFWSDEPTAREMEVTRMITPDPATGSLLVNVKA